MNRQISALLCAIVALALAATQVRTAKAADTDLTVTKVVAATSVSNLDPVGENTEFPASVGMVSVWSKISAKTVPTTIKHVWYFGGTKVFEQSLDIKFSSTRTWSTKSVKPGSWKVDVTDEGGTVLSSVSFSVK